MNNMKDTGDKKISGTHKSLSSDDLQSLISKKDVDSFRAYIDLHDAADIAVAIEDLSDDEAVFLFKNVNDEQASEIFSYLDSQDQIRIANNLGTQEVSRFIGNLATDDLIDFVEDWQDDLGEDFNVTKSINIKKWNTIRDYLHYDKDSAGSIMTNEFVILDSNLTVKSALQRIKKDGRNAETIDPTFVIDKVGTLLGIINLRELLFAEDDELIESIMDSDFVSVTTDVDQEEIGELFKKYDLNVMPVVDEHRILIGIITVDDVMDVMEDEVTEDFQKMAGTAPLDTAYLKTSVLKIARSRVVWLLVLMVSATLTGLIINKFESTLAIVPVLSVFIPMLMDTSGNAGNQTTTTITRAMGIGDVELHDFPRVLFKEFRVSLITGSIVAIFNFLWIFIELQTGIISNTIEVASWIIALQVSLTLYVIIVLAKCLGASLPMLARLIHVDPALMAGPLITTILDTLSLLIYFVIAKGIIPGL